jgi:DNA-directed RNA polymerase subunit RPC12/RpoP
MVDYVTMSCPTCGGKLQITNDLERFACAYCGNEHIVKRSGGVVSLSPIIESLHKVQLGVDRTASELAIPRLEREIQQLESEYNKLFTQREKFATKFMPFIYKREIDDLTQQMNKIMAIARKKNAELEKHRKIVSV